MALLKLLKPVKMGGEIIELGQVVTVENWEILVSNATARRLNKDEVRNILHGYASYAEEIFNGKSKPSESKIKHYEQGFLNLGGR